MITRLLVLNHIKVYKDSLNSLDFNLHNSDKSTKHKIHIKKATKPRFLEGTVFNIA